MSPNTSPYSLDLVLEVPVPILLMGEPINTISGLSLGMVTRQCIRMKFSRIPTEETRKSYLINEDQDQHHEFDPGALARTGIEWKDHAYGVVAELEKLFPLPNGFSCRIRNLDHVKSPSPVAVGMAVGLNELFRLDLDLKEITEVAVNGSAIFLHRDYWMDHNLSLQNKKSFFLLMNNHTRTFSEIPVALKDLVLIKMDTGAHAISEPGKHGINWNELPWGSPYDFFGKLSFQYLEQCKKQLSKVQYNAAFYFLSEQERVLQAVQQVKNDDFVGFGNLMYDSHMGLRDDLRVSTPELDFLVELSKNGSQSLGSRLLYNHGNCYTIHLVSHKHSTEFQKELSAAFEQKYKKPLQVEVLSTGGT